MSALTISAVDSTTDRLTITAHGLNTGDGPALVFTPYGGGGVIPTGLTAGTPYWAIRVDANTVKLATSNALALAGTAVNITTNGTTPLQLLVGLPYLRATTYAALSQIKSLDLDALQDDTAAVWALLNGQPQSAYGDIVLAANKNIVLQGTGALKHGQQIVPIDLLKVRNVNAAAGVTIDTDYSIKMVTAPTNLAVQLELANGKRIVGVGATLQLSAGSLNLNYQSFSGATNPRTLSSAPAGSTSSGTGLQTLTVSPGYTYGSGLTPDGLIIQLVTGSTCSGNITKMWAVVDYP